MKEELTTDQIKKELENLLTSGEPLPDDIQHGPEANDSSNGPLAKVQHPDTQKMDFYQVKAEAEAESKKLLKSVIEFYLDAKIIKKNEYVKYRKAIDEMALSNVMFSLKTTQHAIIKIMEEIDMGNIHPRLFEVLAQLQGQMMSIVKHSASLSVTTEESYKKIKDDFDRIEYQRNMEDQHGNDVDVRDGQPVKSRGTKGIITGIRGEIQDTDFEEVKDDLPRLTDPNNRSDNPGEMSKPLEDHDDETFSVDEDMY